MTRAHRLLALSIAAFVAACGNSSSPAPSAAPPSQVAAAASASPSPSQAASPSPSPSAAATPTPSPTATPAPTPAPWATYTSKQNHYSISYPGGWFVRAGDKDTLDEFDSLGYVRVYAGRQTYAFAVDAADFARQDIAHLRKTVNAKLVSNKPISLARGYTGRIVEMTYTDNGTPVAAIRIIVGKGRIEYDIDMYIDFPKTSPGRELFPQIYKSWRPTP